MHTVILTKVMQTEVELSDEEYEKYADDLYSLFYEYGCFEMETVEKTIEEI
jgi:hypothetical protein